MDTTKTATGEAAGVNSDWFFARGMDPIAAYRTNAWLGSAVLMTIVNPLF